MQPLYKIASEYKELISLIDESGEITEEHLEKLNAIEGDKEYKVVNIGLTIKNLEHLYNGITESMAEMEKRQSKIYKEIEWLKNYLLTYVTLDDLDSIESPDVFFKYRKNRFSLDILNQDFIPKNYYNEKTIYTLSRQSIIDDLKKGIEIPGAQFKTTVNLNVK